MDFLEKREAARAALNNFGDYARNDSYRQFIDIFSPMLYRDCESRLEIRVGRRASDALFLPWLSCAVNCFSVLCEDYNGEPQLIFKDAHNKNRNTIALFNLSMMRDLQIKKEEAPNFCRYTINFRYQYDGDMEKTVDYQMRAAVNRAPS